MKKITGFVLIFLFLTAVSCSSKKKYGDIKEFINEVVATQSKFLLLIDKSANANDMISAVEAFGVKMIMLSEKSMKIRNSYPNIDNWVNDPPDELKDDFKKLDNAESDFEKVFFKERVKTIIKDKQVQHAFIGLNNRMEDVKFFQ